VCSAFLLSGYLLAILIIFILPIVVLAKAALAVLLGCTLVYYLRRDALLLSSSSHVAISLGGEEVTLTTRNGSELHGQILRDSVVTPFLAILNVLPQDGKRVRSVVIFPDSLERERFRELRVLLKWGG